MIFAGYFEHGWKGVLESLHVVSNHFRNMLVYQHDGYVLSFLREAVEHLCDLALLSLLINDEKVLLRIWWFGEMSNASKE